MKNLPGKTGLCLVLVLGLAAPAWGQAPWGAAARGARNMQYDLGTVETLKGTVIKVEQLAPRRVERPSRVQLLLKTDKETVSVLLGPESWFKQQNFSLAPGDQVEVKGSRITRPRRTFIIAGEVRKGGQVLQLRDANGRPLWAPGRQQPTP